MTHHTKPGLYTAAIGYCERRPGAAGELHAAAMGAALLYVRSTGEALRSADDVMILLEQASDDPCLGRCGDIPFCEEHER